MPKSLQFCFRPRRKGTHPGLHPVEGPALVFPQLSLPPQKGMSPQGYGDVPTQSPQPPAVQTLKDLVQQNAFRMTPCFLPRLEKALQQFIQRRGSHHCRLGCPHAVLDASGAAEQSQGQGKGAEA